MTWDAFWSYFDKQDTRTKHDLLKQLDLVHMMQMKPLDVRQEVLKCAPQPLINRIEELLGYAKNQTHYSNSIRRFSRQTN